MAYDRTQIAKRIMQIEQELMTGDKVPAVGEVVDAVVAAGICGRGVAQQVLSELRSVRSGKDAEAPIEIESDAFPDEIGRLVSHLDDLHYEVDKKKRAVGLAAAAIIEDVRATFGVVITDQGLALKRTAEDSTNRIEMLEASLAQALAVYGDVSAKLVQAEVERNELLARVTRAEEERNALLARAADLEMERDQQKGAAEQLRLDLDAHRQDLAQVRQAESALRDELRAAYSAQIDRAEHLALAAEHRAVSAALAHEQGRNAELHSQLLRLVGTIVRPDAEGVPLVTADVDHPS